MRKRSTKEICGKTIDVKWGKDPLHTKGYKGKIIYICKLKEGDYI